MEPENAYVDMGDDLDAHFGYGRLRTPVTNIRSWRLEGPWLWIMAIGIRRGIRDGVFAFDGVHTGGVRLDFHERVPLLRLSARPPCT